jgi:hypothetical protein
VAGILKLATQAAALAGSGGGAITPETLAPAIVGAARAYTAQQSYAPVVRTGASGSQAVDFSGSGLLSITATGALAFAVPTGLAVGRCKTIMIYSASAIAITWDASYAASSSVDLPTTTTAGKLMLLDIICVPTAGGVEPMLTGATERA